jgi:hypothetical protein
MWDATTLDLNVFQILRQNTGAYRRHHQNREGAR